MNKIKANQIIDILMKYHKDAKCELNYETEFQLLIAVILSAQCTDKRVNITTKHLFKVCPTVNEFYSIKTEDLEKLIYSCGFYKNKANNIKKASKIIVEKYNGEIPKTKKELEKLPGVGRKTANVVASVAFFEPAIAVDTHVFRVSNRIGFASAKTHLECEKTLMKLFKKENWTQIHHTLIFHGRYICKSQNPNCQICLVNTFCKYFNKIKG